MRLTAIIETAQSSDYAEIVGFLRAAEDEKLLPRPADDYRRAIESGLFCVARSEGRLVALAGAFVLSKAEPILIEMGSCYVAPAFRGFGLQKLLVRARIAAVISLIDPAARILTAITPQNLGSRASILKAGFEPLTEDHRLLMELCAYCAARPGEASDRLCCCDFFYIPRSRQRSEIAALLEGGPVTVSRANGDSLLVTIDIDALRGLRRAALEAFADARERSDHVGA
ncbi:GNAT family N-acetyltransferase [Methylocella tundrae]|uniref:GCN5-related N-acetyltransferase n=1 Tax=Methylocella tundrae TaxID=227605 RepID=A0A4U8YYF6_METTU|nr:GNAT family N-acetyltransferase [Methylocella tundrae]WPP05641.1 GNAT family N-acetyltransferase [Methylocella tundrae]VFU08108.1 GCN5-related N-acetyltransferase [Methylocella tundrae]